MSTNPTKPLPDTLTLEPCNCRYEGCRTTGFREGMFYQGSGFERGLAEEVKRRYDAFDANQSEIKRLRGKIEVAVRDLEEMRDESFACDPKLYVTQIEKYLRAALAEKGEVRGRPEAKTL